jgi:hypothetical protein
MSLSFCGLPVASGWFDRRLRVPDPKSVGSTRIFGAGSIAAPPLPPAEGLSDGIPRDFSERFAGRLD